MKELIIKNKSFFDLLLRDIEDGEPLTDEPYIWVERFYGSDDYDSDFIEPDQYMKDYCSGDDTCIHLFSQHFHFCYYKDTRDIVVSELFVFNTSEYGVPSEYCRNEIHDSDAENLIIKDSNLFWFNDEEYKLGMSEEEQFQLSCTEFGFYNDVILKTKEMFLKELNCNER